MNTFILRVPAALLALATVWMPVAAQERIDLDHLGLSFELPSDWIAAEPGIHPTAEMRTFTSPDGQLAFAVEVYNFDDQARLWRWVGGEALGRIAGADEMHRIDGHTLSKLGNDGLTFATRQSGNEMDARFFEHRGRGVAILIGGEPSARSEHEALLIAMINSIRVE